MTTLIIEHLKARELPHQWAEQLKTSPEQTVTVRVEIETEQAATEPTRAFVTDDPAFGMWRDHGDMVDVEAYLRKLRAPRYTRK